jgi:hypothetical protein
VIAAVIGMVTLLMGALVAARSVAPEFRRRSERPKYEFLERLGVKFEKENEKE